jgi:integrase
MGLLKARRVDLKRRRLDIAEAVTEPDGEIIWGTPKNHERRSVPFPTFLSNALKQRMEGRNPDDLIFPSPKGDVLRNGNFRRRRFDAAVDQLRADYPELPKITPHSLRHTAASLAISAGATVLAVQRMLGHASASMTLDVYNDLFDDDLDAVANALDARARSTDVGKMWAKASTRVDPERSETDTPQ